MDCTNEMCVPKLRWIPEQDRHTKQPKLTDAHDGRLFGQSAQTRFSGNAITFLHIALRSACDTRFDILAANDTGPL